jgi:copper chaperone CopZ
MKELQLTITGMSCMHCAMAVKKEFSKLPLESSDVQVGSAKVVFDENKVNEKQIVDAVEEAGYKVVS